MNTLQALKYLSSDKHNLVLWTIDEKGADISIGNITFDYYNFRKRTFLKEMDLKNNKREFEPVR